MKFIYACITILLLTGCGSGNHEETAKDAPAEISKTDSQMKDQLETEEQGFDQPESTVPAELMQSWEGFKTAVSDNDLKTLTQYLVFPMQGDCLENVIALSTPSQQITAVDFSVHGGKMLTDKFKALVDKADLGQLLSTKNADNRFDLVLHEKSKSFDGYNVEFSTIYQFQVLGEQIKMVAIYCAG